ncbi:MAG: STAS domain-containing protein [Pirellulaceae bacterium]
MFERKRQGAVSVVVGDAPLTKELLGQLQTVFEPLLRTGQPRVVFDLHEVPLLDSAGLELLLDMQDALEQRGGELKLAAPTTLLHEALTITGVSRRFEIFKDAMSAVGSFVQ